MTTGTQTCDLVLPGYELTERLGAGGFAEVWRAHAPGGFEKAVKIVHGYLDDEFASQELKALERVKGVRHPFLLSLERFEVIGGRLAIITELADMSLDQRLRQCRADGLPGIPRDELLRYLADAAEALDFLAQRHKLLHLDIKPENLLILGDHVKVADFGLVKELVSRTQNSLVAGLTPTYASPEMFDDNPSAHSDQYSLAIVYQEMLVGVLPFPGRTAAQLAMQHVQAEPQLLSLPATDRPIVARALAKRPADRFPSCRAFIDALLHGADSAPPAPTAPTAVQQPTPATPIAPVTLKSGDTKPPSPSITVRRGVAAPADKPAPSPPSPSPTVTQPRRRATPTAAPSPPPPSAPLPPAAPEPTVDVPVPPSDPLLQREQPTLYVGLGGLGIQLLCRLRARILPTHSDDAPDNPRPAIEAVAFDTNRDELREAASPRAKSPLVAADTLHLPLRLPKSYDESGDDLGWLSRRWLYNIPRSLETRGYRPLGRLALVDHARRAAALLDDKLARLATLCDSPDATGQPRDHTIKVVLLAGTGGGTGAGMLIDLANAVRALAAQRQLAVEVHGLLVCPPLVGSNASPLTAANSFSLLAELNHASAVGNQGPGEPPHAGWFESEAPPFDHVYWIPARTRTDDTPAHDVLETAARYLALDRLAEPRAVLRACLATPTPRELPRTQSLTLRKFGFAAWADQQRSFLAQLAAELADAVRDHWLEVDATADWEKLLRNEQAADAARIASQTAAAKNNVADPARPPSNEVPPPSDTTPLALRARFQQHAARVFASDLLQLVDERLAARDDRGRPLLLPREARQLVEAARTTLESIAAAATSSPTTTSRVSDSPALQPLVAAAGRRVLRQAVDNFDPRQPDHFLPADALDDLLHSACQHVLEEKLADPAVAAAVTALADVEAAVQRLLDEANTDLFQCGCDRRTILFVPHDRPLPPDALDKLRAARPLVDVVPAPLDDPIVVCNDAGLSPRSLAQRLDRVFPGIADAARRLHTRIDVSWQSLL